MKRFTFVLTGFFLLSVLSGCNESSDSDQAQPSQIERVQAHSRSEMGSLISGETAYINGTFIWTDYAYDDRGADTNQIPGGDASYPDPPHPGNTADLIQLQMSSSQRGLTVRLVMQTLVDGYELLAGIGFDIDSDTATGAASLPGGAWSNNLPLGLDRLVLLNSNGTGQVLHYLGGEWIQVETLQVQVDRDSNVIDVTIGSLQPAGQTWKAVSVLGPADDGRSWLSGDADIYDLAFVRAEDPVTDPALALQEQVPQVQRPWQDKVQANILAGLADATTAVASIQFGSKMTVLPTTGPGLHTFLYRSELKLEEGVRPDPLQFRGLYQPYVVKIPQGVETTPPAIIFMHGSDQNHLVNAVHFSEEGMAISGFYSVPAVVVFPMGRDPHWGTGLSEKDLLDVTDDAIARLGLDAERIVLSGISAGGIGTFRHAMRYPDRWTGGYSIVGGGVKALGNLRNLPLRAHNGLLDPLVDVTFWQESADALALTEGVDYRTVLIHTSSHLPSPLGNCWYLQMLAKPRQVNPARVTYAIDTGDYFVDQDSGLDLRPRSAYWVEELVARVDGQAAIDAVSLARADRATNAIDIDQYGSSVGGADFCGSNPELVGNDTWQELGREQIPADPLSVENAMALTLVNLAEVAIDIERMGLASDQGIRIGVLDNDGVTVLKLRGEWKPPVRVENDQGDRVDSVIENGQLRFTLPAGSYAFFIN